MMTSTTVYFGYGDIFVQVDKETHSLIFKELERSYECGTHIGADKAKFSGDEIRLDNMSWEDCEEFANLLEAVEEHRIFEFEFGGYMFNFEKFNEGSLQTIGANLAVLHYSFYPEGCYERSICLEPVTLDKEEYDEAEWNTYLKVFGHAGDENVTRLRVNIVSVESWKE